MDVDRRVERLEKERWLYLGLAVLAVVVAVVATLMASKAAPKSSSAGGGATVLSVSQGEALVLQDAKGAKRAALGLDAKGLPWLKFFDTSNKLRQHVGFGESGQPEMVLYNETEKERGKFRISDSGLPSLDFYDAGGARRETLGFDLTGAPYLEIIGPDDKARVTLKEEPSGGSLMLRDARGAVIGQLPQRIGAVP